MNVSFKGQIFNNLQNLSLLNLVHNIHPCSLVSRNQIFKYTVWREPRYMIAQLMLHSLFKDLAMQDYHVFVFTLAILLVMRTDIDSVIIVLQRTIIVI